MTRRTAGMVAIWCAMGLLGCGGEEDVVRSFTERLVEAHCSNLFRCSNGRGATHRARLGTEERCIAERSQLGLWMPGQPPQGLIDTGRVRFDADAAERCVELWTDSCSYNFERDEACSSVWVGRVDDGDGCIDDAECASGVCTGSHEACGSCAASAPLGAECSEDRPCAPSEHGLVECAWPDAGGPSVCVLFEPPPADAAEGDSCGRSTTGETGCGEGLFCREGICETRIELGVPCDPMFDSCVIGTLCQFASETCVAVRVEARLGEPCGAHGDEFITCDPTTGLVCDSSAGCVRDVTPASEGEPCVGVPCASGLLCVRFRCIAPQPHGASCVEGGECASGFCNQDSFMCAAWPTCE